MSVRLNTREPLRRLGAFTRDTRGNGVAIVIRESPKWRFAPFTRLERLELRTKVTLPPIPNEETIPDSGAG